VIGWCLSIRPIVSLPKEYVDMLKGMMPDISMFVVVFVIVFATCLLLFFFLLLWSCIFYIIFQRHILKDHITVDPIMCASTVMLLSGAMRG